MKVSQVLVSFPSLRGWPSPVDLSIHLIKDCGGGQSWRLGFIKKSNYFFISKKKCKKRKQKKHKKQKHFTLSCSDSGIKNKIMQEKKIFKTSKSGC